VVALRQLVEVLEQIQVDNARARGWSWSDIARRLGVTKQAVHYSTGYGSGTGRRSHEPDPRPDRSPVVGRPRRRALARVALAADIRCPPTGAGSQLRR
jgi:hypothetical protein